MSLDFIYLETISWIEIGIRVFLAAGFGLILGWDRDSKNKPIDFRAYMIVCVTTCLIAILSVEVSADFKNQGDLIKLDLGKIVAGVLTGIGFLGAGAIIHRENKEVIGTATGASIWSAGGMGLALGYGVYGLALFGFITIAVILIGGGFLMAKMHGESDKEDLLAEDACDCHSRQG